MAKTRRALRKRLNTPMATVALVLAVALGSAVIWVTFATKAPSPDTIDPPWWLGLQAVPTR